MRNIIKKFYLNLFYPNSISIKGENSFFVNKGFARNLNVKIQGNNNNVSIAAAHLNNVKIIIIGNNNDIEINNNVIASHCEFWIEDSFNKIFIGAGTTIEKNSQVAALEGREVIIGEDCMISSDVKISTSDSHSIIDVVSNDRENYAKSVFIGKHVWIGHSVCICKGVEIKDNCIVGAKSNVLGKFSEENIIIAGNPAKVIKKNKNWLRERI
ncbi:acyltransferase [Flavobacterium sp. W20_MBD1_R3]|uniref:acyltransferase n=1 Tax=Flavobacterium sp. W20_MBD1_R3 TaxID=3240278 RepID=UPI003F912189